MCIHFSYNNKKMSVVGKTGPEIKVHFSSVSVLP